MCTGGAMYWYFVKFSVMLVKAGQQLNPAPCVMLVEARPLNPAPSNSTFGNWD